MSTPDLNDEVEFWRELTHWWEVTQKEPAPKRMHEALAHAEFKRSRLGKKFVTEWGLEYPVEKQPRKN